MAVSSVFCENKPTRFYKLTPRPRFSSFGEQRRRAKPSGSILGYCEEHWKHAFEQQPWIDVPKDELITMDIIER